MTEMPKELQEKLAKAAIAGGSWANVRFHEGAKWMREEMIKHSRIYADQHLQDQNAKLVKALEKFKTWLTSIEVVSGEIIQIPEIVRQTASKALSEVKK